jgi:hypothetical protein
MLTEGVWAEVQVGKEHLRLFSENNAQGTQASVYNVNTKSWIAPSEEVEESTPERTLRMSQTRNCRNWSGRHPARGSTSGGPISEQLSALRSQKLAEDGNVTVALFEYEFA